MLKINYCPLRVIFTVFTFCLGCMIFSCSPTDEGLVPDNDTNAGNRVMKKDSYARIASTSDVSSCGDLAPSVLNGLERDLIVTTYGSAGGVRYDDHKASYELNPNLYNISHSRVYYYVYLIQYAITTQAKFYSDFICINPDYCDEEVRTIDTDAIKSTIEVGLISVIANINSDVLLTSDDKNILNAVIDSYRASFDRVSDLAMTWVDCFPNPSWFDNSHERGIFSKIAKVLKKAVNIIATILVEVVKTAVYTSIQGLALGSIFGHSAPGFVVGAVIGAGIGLVNGVNRALNGDLVCIIGCSP